jgi:hypothetical protein
MAITREEQRAAKAALQLAKTERRAAAAEVQEAKAEQRELVAQQTIMLPIAVAKPAGLVNKPVWKFEVTNLGHLYGARADLCNVEASASRINEAIRNGMTECPGLRIWQEQSTTVRV